MCIPLIQERNIIWNLHFKLDSKNKMNFLCSIVSYHGCYTVLEAYADNKYDLHGKLNAG